MARVYGGRAKPAFLQPHAAAAATLEKQTPSQNEKEEKIKE